MDFLLLAVLGLMILFLIMQNRRRRREAELLQSSIAVGSEVVLHAGIVGKVVAVSENHIDIESGKSRFTVLRGAVGKVNAAGEK